MSHERALNNRAAVSLHRDPETASDEWTHLSWEPAVRKKSTVATWMDVHASEQQEIEKALRLSIQMEDREEQWNADWLLPLS